LSRVPALPELSDALGRDQRVNVARPNLCRCHFGAIFVMIVAHSGSASKGKSRIARAAPAIAKRSRDRDTSGCLRSADVIPKTTCAGHQHDQNHDERDHQPREEPREQAAGPETVASLWGTALGRAGEASQIQAVQAGTQHDV
jgi:hypothetical protein